MNHVSVDRGPSMDHQEPVVSTDGLENRIFEGLRTLQEQYPDGKVDRSDPALEAGVKALIERLEQDIYAFLYRELRRVATKLPGLGWAACSTDVDVSARFTSVLNSAFERILSSAPDKLYRTRTRKELTGYVSRTMTNLMLSHYKRKQIHKRAVGKLGLTATDTDMADAILARLAEIRAAYFESRIDIPFESALETIIVWGQSADPELGRRASVLRLRYVEGLSYDGIASDMGIAKADVERLLDRAKYHLRKDA